VKQKGENWGCALVVLLSIFAGMATYRSSGSVSLAIIGGIAVLVVCAITWAIVFHDFSDPYH
jgi:hypothetical protein